MYNVVLQLAAMCHMGLFSYVIIMELNPLVQPVSFSVAEIILWIWTLSIFIEEVRQVSRETKLSYMQCNIHMPIQSFQQEYCSNNLSFV